MYEYTLVFKNTNQHSNTDALSRLPLNETVDAPPPEETVLLLQFLDKALCHPLKFILGHVEIQCYSK